MLARIRQFLAAAPRSTHRHWRDSDIPAMAGNTLERAPDSGALFISFAVLFIYRRYISIASTINWLREIPRSFADSIIRASSSGEMENATVCVLLSLGLRPAPSRRPPRIFFAVSIFLYIFIYHITIPQRAGLSLHPESHNSFQKSSSRAGPPQRSFRKILEGRPMRFLHIRNEKSGT